MAGSTSMRRALRVLNFSCSFSSSYLNVVNGDNGVVRDTDVVVGDDAEVVSDDDVVVSDDNVVVGEHDVVLGDDDVVVGDYNVVVGDDDGSEVMMTC
jgi:hypothetical protein